MKPVLQLLSALAFLSISFNALAGPSVYTEKFDDPHGVFFTEETYGIKADGKMDVSDALQTASIPSRQNVNSERYIFLKASTVSPEPFTYQLPYA